MRLDILPGNAIMQPVAGYFTQESSNNGRKVKEAYLLGAELV
jgi:hypothetical protein